MRLLVVEDNPELAGLICAGLRRAGYDCDIERTAAGAGEALSRLSYAAMLLDLGLPDRDGHELLRALRAQGVTLPVLILTARGSLEERLAGLGEGADDFVVKPVAMEELVARVQALLRRPGHLLPSLLTVGDLGFDTGSRQVFVREEPQTFYPREISVLELLIRRKGEVVSTSYIEEQLFGADPRVSNSALEIAVFRLRRRLEAVQAGVTIHNVRGVGYLLTEKASA